ncbi:MAG: DUF4375 domain-containing protein [Coprobacillus sp.]
MSNETFNTMVWILTFAMVVFLTYFITKRLKLNKKEKLAAMRVYEEKKQKYTYLKPGIFDMCPREDVGAAALFHCMRKEDEDFENYFEKMNYSEKVIFGIYQVTLALNGPHASLHSFFLSPASQPFVPQIVDIFESVGSHDIAALMKAAKRFAEIIENDEDDDEDDDPEMGEFSKYNFSDFTNEFLTLVSSTNLNEKMTEFILAHKEDFYDNDIPEEIEESGDDIDEGISE